MVRRLPFTLVLTAASAVLTASVSFARQTPANPPASPPLPPPPSATVGMHNPPWYPPQLVPLEQGYEDRSAFDESLRVPRVDLSVPGGFKQVYQVPGRDDLLMRVNGGMYAVFPESYYRGVSGGAKPLIPPGTIFYIGEPPTNRPVVPGQPKVAPPVSLAPRDEIDPRVNGKWDRRIVVDDAGVKETNGEVDPETPVGRDREAAMVPPPRIPRLSTPVIRTVATDERFRMMRLSTLLDRATEAAVSKAP